MFIILNAIIKNMQDDFLGNVDFRFYFEKHDVKQFCGQLGKFKLEIMSLNLANSFLLLFFYR